MVSNFFQLDFDLFTQFWPIRVQFCRSDVMLGRGPIRFSRSPLSDFPLSCLSNNNARTLEKEFFEDAMFMKCSSVVINVNKNSSTFNRKGVIVRI